MNRNFALHFHFSTLKSLHLEFPENDPQNSWNQRESSLNMIRFDWTENPHHWRWWLNMPTSIVPIFSRAGLGGARGWVSRLPIPHSSLVDCLICWWPYCYRLIRCVIRSLLWLISDFPSGECPLLFVSLDGLIVFPRFWFVWNRF